MAKDRAYELVQFFADGSMKGYFEAETGDFYFTEHTACRRIIREMKETEPDAFNAPDAIGYGLFRIGEGFNGDRERVHAPEFGCEQLIYIPAETI